MFVIKLVLVLTNEVLLNGHQNVENDKIIVCHRVTIGTINEPDKRKSIAKMSLRRLINHIFVSQTDDRHKKIIIMKAISTVISTCTAWGIRKMA